MPRQQSTPNPFQHSDQKVERNELTTISERSTKCNPEFKRTAIATFPQTEASFHRAIIRSSQPVEDNKALSADGIGKVIAQQTEEIQSAVINVEERLHNPAHLAKVSKPA